MLYGYRYKEHKRAKSGRLLVLLLFLCFFRLTLGFGIGFWIRVWVRFKFVVRAKLSIYLFLRNVIAPSAFFYPVFFGIRALRHSAPTLRLLNLMTWSPFFYRNESTWWYNILRGLTV